MKLSTREYRMLEKHGLGSSDAAAIMGLTERPSAADVYLRFINGRTNEDNIYMRAGRAMEPVILQEYAEQSKKILTLEDVIYIHPKYDFLVTKPDALTDDSYVEAKLTTHEDNYGAEGTDAVPDYVFCQVQHGMEVTGKDYAEIPVIIWTRWLMEFRLYAVARSNIIIPQMLELEKKFWEHNILGKIPPEPKTLDDARKLWPSSQMKSIEADSETVDAITELKELKQEIKEAERRKDFLELQVKTKMKDAEALRFSEMLLATWKSNAVKRIDVKRLKDEKPEIAEEFTKETEERRFLVK
ncbi:MAG TPA: YqaJ viral recombinase family protein [Candidatus Kryptobacter bacterium]|nr:YqaJ viral recombinase family protein [Candidatus Kryptobacter bacterium]